MTESDPGFHPDGWAQTIIDYLADTDDGTASLDDLIDHIIDQETNAIATDRETVTYEIMDWYLPKLADNGVVEFNDRTGIVRYRTPPER